MRRISGYLLGAQGYNACHERYQHPDSRDQGEYAHITTCRLVPGKAGAFTEFMKNDYLPLMKKADEPNLWLSRPIFGGDLDERVMVRPMHKVAELDAGPLTTKALGTEERANLGSSKRPSFEPPITR